MNKSWILIAGLLTCQVFCRAQQVTLDPYNGRELISNNTPNQAPDTIATSSVVYHKSDSATLKASSHVVYNIDVYIDPKKWAAVRVSDTIEYKFYRAGTYENMGMLISEQNRMSLLDMKSAVLRNASRGGPSGVRLIKEEYRNVNGRKVLFLKFTTLLGGIGFTYWGYYYSSEYGITQLLTFTPTGLSEKNEEDFEDFLNGLVIGN